MLTLVTRKLQVVYGNSTYWMTALLSEFLILCVRAACKIQIVAYGSKFASHCLPAKPFLHTYTHNFKSSGHVLWMFCIWNNCYIIVYIFMWCWVAWDIHLESYGLRHASFVLWCNIMCLYWMLINTPLFGVQLIITANLRNLWLPTIC